MTINWDQLSNPDAFVTPRQCDEAAKILDKMRQYCNMKGAAMRLRLDGSIQSAIEVERKLELLYKSLPPEIRW